MEWIKKGDNYFQNKDFNKALNYYMKSIEREPNNREVCERIGLIYYHKKNFKKALVFFKKVLKIDSLQNNFSEIDLLEKNLINIGKTLEHLKCLIEALKYYKKALKIAIQSHNREKQFLMLNLIGNDYRKLKKYLEAINYYKIALEIAGELNDPIKKANVYNNIGLLYFKQEKKKKGTIWLENAINILRKNKKENSKIARKILQNLKNSH